MQYRHGSFSLSGLNGLLVIMGGFSAFDELDLTPPTPPYYAAQLPVPGDPEARAARTLQKLCEANAVPPRPPRQEACLGDEGGKLSPGEARGG